MSLVDIKGYMSKKARKKGAFTTELIVSSMAIMLTTSILFATVNNNNISTALAQPMPHRGFPFIGTFMHFRFGTIGSIQNDQDGKPAWIVSGVWKTNLLNQSSNIVNSSNSMFDTSFRMLMLNGSAMHTHSITNFVLQNKSMPNKTVQVFNGTTTVSMKEGPVTNVPTSIKVMNNQVISIMLDQSKLKNHFGNTPIYGVVFEPRPGMHMGSNPGPLTPPPPRM